MDEIWWTRVRTIIVIVTAIATITRESILREMCKRQNHGENERELLSRHRQLMKKYAEMKRQLDPKNKTGPITDNDAIARNYNFIMDSDASKAQKWGRCGAVRFSWEQRLAIRYYNRLYKEYALVDLTYYEINKIGMRWRTEREVIDGKGQFSCGNLHCDNTNTHELCSYEVPFRYKDLEGKVVSTLVKVRLCGPCAYHQQQECNVQTEAVLPENPRDRIGVS